MVKIHKFRPEDYWLFAVSALAIFFTGVALYAGTNRLRLLGVLLGVPGLIFVTYIIRRSYSKRRAQVHLLICLLVSASMAFSAYLLTN